MGHTHARIHAHSGDKPLLFVDIDGVISLFGFEPTAPPPGTWIGVDGVLHLDFGHGVRAPPRARTRIFDLVWCSGWEEKASDHLVPVLRLPVRPPFLTFSAPTGTAHWKLDAVDGHAGDRPAAWIDDAFDDSCHAWAAARDAPTLLVATDPAVGMTTTSVARLERWARGLGGSGGPAGRLRPCPAPMARRTPRPRVSGHPQAASASPARRCTSAGSSGRSAAA